MLVSTVTVLALLFIGISSNINTALAEKSPSTTLTNPAIAGSDSATTPQIIHRLLTEEDEDAPPSTAGVEAETETAAEEAGEEKTKKKKHHHHHKHPAEEKPNDSANEQPQTQPEAGSEQQENPAASKTGGVDVQPTTNSCSLQATCADCVSQAAALFESTQYSKSCKYGLQNENDDAESCYEVAVVDLTLEDRSFQCSSGEKYQATNPGENSIVKIPDSETQSNYDKIQGEGEDEEEEGSILGAFVMVAFFIGAMYVRQKILERNGSVLVGDGAGGIIGGDDLSTIMTTSTSGRTGSTSGRGGGSRFNQETVPLSSATDEEWGWEDGMDTAGDVEMSTPSTSNANKEDDDLQMALALSLSEKQKPPTSSSSSSVQSKTKTKTKAKPKKTLPAKDAGKTNDVGISSDGKRTREFVSRRSSPRTTKATSPAADDWDEPIPSPDVQAPTDDPNDIEALLESTRPKHMANSSFITSFSKKAAAPKPPTKKVEKKKEEDDIFASMGLSSYPGAGSSSTPKPSPPSSGTGWGGTSSASKATTTTTTPAPKSSLLEANDFGDEDGSADWGDDSDLDDLLDD